ETCSALCMMLVCVSTGVDSIDLIQPDSKVVQPGQSLTISCRVSGYSLTDSSYGSGWTRQREGKPMDWTVHQWTSYYKYSLKNKFSIDVDSSNKRVTLNGQNMQPEDTAVYFYSALCNGGYFDYWGKGTEVTVTSATPQTPDVFPLIPCGSPSGDTVTLGCIATGFTPSSWKFSWKLGTDSLENVTQYPSIPDNDKYLGISQVQVSRQDWDAKKTFQCVASYRDLNSNTNVNKPDVLYRSPHLTTSFSLDEEKQQASFYCFAKDFAPRNHNISWEKVGSDKTSILDVTSVFSEGRNDTNGAKLYSAASLLTVNPTDLTPGATFTCVFKGKGSTECLQAAVDIKIIGPTYRDILVEQRGKITCKIQVNNGRLEKIYWANEGEIEMAGTVKSEGFKKQEELELDITYDEWHQGSVVSFIVHTVCFLVLTGGPAQRPSVLMLPPVEHARNNEVTLTCSVKDFFPEEVFVAWLVDDVEVDSKYKISTTSPVEKDGSYLVYSQLTLTLDEWKQAGPVYSCAVYHETLTNSTRSIVRSIGFSTADQTNLVNLNLNLSEKCKA
uniref:Ig-like domain-containing protein n=1 Tax=Oryzias melastigma TaxID=30732 RepID=A0A3B3DSR9_ORYME